MTTPVIEPRIRRPKDKEQLIQQLLAENDGPFTTMRDVLLSRRHSAGPGNAMRNSERPANPFGTTCSGGLRQLRPSSTR